MNLGEQVNPFNNQQFQVDSVAADIGPLLNKLNYLVPTLLGNLILILGVPPLVMPGAGATHGDQVNALITWAESPTGPGLAKVREELDRIICSSGIRRPISNISPEDIKRIIEEELRLTQRAYGDSVSQGLNALTELMKNSEARSSVITFRVDFQAVCNQINVIANYKELHDLLHTLEFQCYSGIIAEANRFPNDDTALTILTDHELTLLKILEEVQNLTRQETIAFNELSWLRDLKLAQTELHNAIEELDTRHLKRTIWLLNRILAIQPSRINTNLNSAARTLRLPNLVNALRSIWESLAASNLNQEKLSQFQVGVEVLANLNERLLALVDGHDYWQEIDLELRRIEANLENGFTELEMSWPDLKEQTEVLLNPTEEQWTTSFQQDGKNLNAALNNQNPAKIKRYFRVYRRRASERFYQVDVTLKRLCEELREVGEPLASVLRMIE